MKMKKVKHLIEQKCSLFSEEPAAAAPSTRTRRPRRTVNFDEFQPDDEDGWD